MVDGNPKLLRCLAFCPISLLGPSPTYELLLPLPPPLFSLSCPLPLYIPTSMSWLSEGKLCLSLWRGYGWYSVDASPRNVFLGLVSTVAGWFEMRIYLCCEDQRSGRAIVTVRDLNFSGRTEYIRPFLSIYSRISRYSGGCS